MPLRNDLAGGFQSIHFGHLHIDEDHIIRLTFNGFYSFQPIRCNIRRGTPFAQGCVTQVFDLP